MAQIELQMFGAFRDFNTDNTLVFDYTDGMSVSDLKDLIRSEFNGQEPYVSLLDRSRIADEKYIFMEDETLTGAGDYAILPPVNGG